MHKVAKYTQTPENHQHFHPHPINCEHIWVLHTKYSQSHFNAKSTILALFIQRKLQGAICKWRAKSKWCRCRLRSRLSKIVDGKIAFDKINIISIKSDLQAKSIRMQKLRVSKSKDWDTFFFIFFISCVKRIVFLFHTIVLISYFWWAKQFFVAYCLSHFFFCMKDFALLDPKHVFYAKDQP